MTRISERIYLDFNATAPLRPEAREAMLTALLLCGNPSSVHAEGRAARALIERARHLVAELVGADAKNVIFTSGGTEAANLALTPHVETQAFGRGFDCLLIAAAEHACVLKGHRFPPDRVSILPVRTDGVLDLVALDETLACREGRRVVLALQLANNETGVIQPVAEVARRVHARDGIVVCDAVQAAGKIPIELEALGADALILSAHKFGGPKGAGALVLRSDRLHIKEPLVRGGGQEHGARAGTENVAAIAGFGAACRAVASVAEEAARLTALRGSVEGCIRKIAPDAVVFGENANRLPNTIAFAVPGLAAETLLIGLDLEGVAVSSGSACSSGKVARSHVLDAMGVTRDQAAGAIRLSLGWSSTERDIAGFAEAFATVVSKMRARRNVAA
ncbi:MAG: cysteine desulfurase [Methylobacteriaceae bacterium]|nr:cysteine desulfurase [Methylobacteriaceae bacterium]